MISFGLVGRASLQRSRPCMSSLMRTPSRMPAPEDKSTRVNGRASFGIAHFALVASGRESSTRRDTRSSAWRWRSASTSSTWLNTAARQLRWSNATTGGSCAARVPIHWLRWSRQPEPARSKSQCTPRGRNL